MEKLALELMEIVPNWQKVNLTKAGYNIQYLETIKKLAKYIEKREGNIVDDLF